MVNIILIKFCLNNFFIRVFIFGKMLVWCIVMFCKRGLICLNLVMGEDWVI